MTARASVLWACVALLPWPAAGQGIGDAAAREKARRAREAAGKAAEPPTYTNDNLGDGKPASPKKEGGPAAAPDTYTPPEPLPDPEPSSAQRAAEAEREYVEAVETARKQLAALEAKVQELQARLNPMSSTYVYGGGGATANDEIRVRNELRDSEAQLPAARQAVETATRALADFRAGRRPPPAPAPVG